MKMKKKKICLDYPCFNFQPKMTSIGSHKVYRIKSSSENEAKNVMKFKPKTFYTHLFVLYIQTLIFHPSKFSNSKENKQENVSKMDINHINSSSPKLKYMCMCCEIQYPKAKYTPLSLLIFESPKPPQHTHTHLIP